MKASSQAVEDAPFTQFETLLARRQAFVLLNYEGVDKSEHQKPSHEEMKQVSLWMKLHKAELRTFVKAMIYIEPSATKWLAIKAFATIYMNFWGYPILMVANLDEAQALAQELLLG
jgi:hypothetical protein